MSSASTLQFMDHRLQNAIRYGDIGQLQQAGELILSQKTATLNTALHIAVQYERTDCVELILGRCPSLLWSQNMKGDTALHIAARLCLPSITKLLLLHEKKAIDESDVLLESGGLMERSRNLVRVLNKENDTALHEAARNCRKEWPESVENGPDEVGRMLIEADREYEYTANAAGETPLFLAAENVYGSSSTVAHILEVWPSAAHDGPNGMTALHAAAKCNNEDAVNVLLAKKPALAGQADNDGWTALHYAADRLSYVLYNAFIPLLHYDTTLAVRQDKNGMTPLHVALSHSNTIALDLLLKLCPECQEVVDNEGRNYLHIAIMRGDKKMVKYISRSGYLTKVIINQPDNYGNTPLHVAALYKKCGIIIYLMNKAYPILNFMAINKENLTAFGIIDKVKVRDDEGVDKKYAGAWLMLLTASRIYRGRTKLAEESDTLSQTEKEIQDKTNKRRKEKVTSQIQNVSDSHLVVATLIATVAFAAGFALPGGYKSDGKDEGMATLLRRGCFEAFAISNTVAMIFSSFAIVIHFVLKLIEDQALTSVLLMRAFLCTLAAIIAMMVAFVTGTYSVLANSPGLAISACTIGCTFYLFSGILLGRHYADIKFPF